MIYSTLFGDGGAPVGNTPFFTVPADGKTYIVRCFSLWCHGGAPATAFGYVYNKGPLGLLVAGANDEMATWNQRYVLSAGDQLNIDVSAGTWFYQCSGYVLD